MSQLREKVKKAVERLKAFAPANGEAYHLSFSGGKDSQVIKALADMANVPYEAHYRITSVDPPELVQFVKEKYPDVHRDIPRDTEGRPITMWNLIPRKLMPPTRLNRFCCRYLKESAGDGKMTITGVRWAEGTNRSKNQGLVTVVSNNIPEDIRNSTDFSKTKKGGIILVNDNTESRRMVEQCYMRHKTTLNPIVDWSNSDVWQFIRGEGMPYCKLYDCGWERIGCLMCPMAKRREKDRETILYPKYKQAYLRTFEKMLAERARRGLESSWDTADDVWRWWIEEKNIDGQMDLFDIGGTT